MQIREISLTELHIAYEILRYKQENITYKEFEDLIYEMKKENYKIIMIINKEKPVTYAGIKIETNLLFKKHLHLYELVTNIEEKTIYYNHEMILYLIDYAKINMCKNILLSVDEDDQDVHELIMINNFKKIKSSYIKAIN